MHDDGVAYSVKWSLKFLTKAGAMCKCLSNALYGILPRTIEHQWSCFTLVFPVLAIGIEDTMTKKISSSMAELGSFDIVFEIVYVK